MMILRPSYLHNGISYTGKMTSLYWISALVTKCRVNLIISMTYCVTSAGHMHKCVSIAYAGLDISRNFYLSNLYNFPFFNTGYIWFRRKLCLKPLAWLARLFTPGHQAMGYVKFWYEYSFIIRNNSTYDGTPSNNILHILFSFHHTHKSMTQISHQNSRGPSWSMEGRAICVGCPCIYAHDCPRHNYDNKPQSNIPWTINTPASGDILKWPSSGEQYKTMGTVAIQRFCLKTVTKIGTNIYRSDVQVTFELYSYFKCLQVIYTK